MPVFVSPILGEMAQHAVVVLSVQGVHMSNPQMAADLSGGGCRRLAGLLLWARLPLGAASDLSRALRDCTHLYYRIGADVAFVQGVQSRPCMEWEVRLGGRVMITRH